MDIAEKFYYDPNNRRKYYKVDCYSEVRNIVWEYEGPDHYENVWKLRRDERRQDYFVNMGIKFLRWPYYCQLTKDVAQYFFGEYYAEKKYATAISEIYGANEESGILGPGFHTTKNTPANFVARGERRFLAELDEFPVSLKHQVIHCLKMYIQAVDDPYLVITESEAMRELVVLEPEKKYLQYYFSRENVEFLENTAVTSVVATDEPQRGAKKPWKSDQDKTESNRLLNKILDAIEDKTEIYSKGSRKGSSAGFRLRSPESDIVNFALYTGTALSLVIYRGQIAENLELFDRLAKRKCDIEQELGQKLVWKRNANAKRQQIILASGLGERVKTNRKVTGNTTPPREMWDEVVAFFSNNAPKFEQVMRKFLSEVS